MGSISRNSWKVLVVAFMLYLSGTFDTKATAQVREMTTGQLAERSELIAVGKVTRMNTEWNHDRTRIVTRVEVTVNEYLKGNAGNSITILSPGGEIDGIGEWYSHNARFANDEDVVVFAQKDAKGNLRVAGGNQGKLSVKKEESTGKVRVSDRTTLDDLKVQIKNALRSQEIREVN